jgi:hypothetical protein
MPPKIGILTGIRGQTYWKWEDKSLNFHYAGNTWPLIQCNIFSSCPMVRDRALRTPASDINYQCRA